MTVERPTTNTSKHLPYSKLRCYTSIAATVSGHSHDQRKKLSKMVCSHPKMKQIYDSMHDCIMLLATTVRYPGFQYLLLFVEGIRTHFQNLS